MQARSASMGVLGALVTVAAVGIANVQPVGATRAATSPVVAPGIEAVAPLGTGGAPESMSRDGRYIAYQTTDSSLDR